MAVTCCKSLINPCFPIKRRWLAESVGEFFENAHDPENFQLHLFTGDIFNGTFAADEAGERVAQA